MNTKRQNNLEGVIVTGKAMGELIGITARQVRALAQEGIIPKLSNGSYELVPAMNEYIEFLKQSQKEDKKELKKAATFEEERTKHERAKRIKAELMLSQMRGDVHDAEDVERVMTEMLMNFKTRLLALPTKVAPTILGYDEIPMIESILRENIIEVLDELSDYNPDDFRSDKYIELEDEEEIPSDKS